MYQKWPNTCALNCISDFILLIFNYNSRNSFGKRKSIIERTLREEAYLKGLQVVP